MDSISSMDTNKPSKALNITLWVVQCLLAAMFLMSGIMKLIMPIDKMADKMAWVKDMPGIVRFIGISEILGAVGLLLPSILRIKPILTPWAAIGIAVIMLLAAGLHFYQGEVSHALMVLIILAASIFVAWGRFGKAAIRPR